MPTSNLTVSGDIGGVAVNSSFSRTATGQIAHDVTLNAAKTGTLTTRTDNTSGIATLEAGHGITAGNVVDLYWTGGRRYNVNATAVATNDVTFSGGTGDNLPVATTALTMAKQQTIDTDFVGNLLVAIGALAAARAHISFYESLTLRLSVDLTANELWFWVNGGTAANPLAAASVTHIIASQAGTTAAALKIGALYTSA
ncbi:MAG: hypothetical protein HZB38_07425 [Planctomycetes bacterium]|nr:hypothetical protein [Planctomycetota bacterium]